MKSKIFILFCLLIGISFISCNSNKTASNKEELDTVWNEKVQDTFYGLKLGATISTEDIVQTIESHGFILNKGYSSDDELKFTPHQKQIFTFGNRFWEMLYIERTNNIFTGIAFMNSSLDKASSLNHYNSLKNEVNTKYSPTEVLLKDTTIYAQTRYFGKNNIGATISCFRYETVSKNIMIGTTLTYWTMKNIKPANDEL